jgi:hypothetical protein
VGKVLLCGERNFEMGNPPLLLGGKNWENFKFEKVGKSAFQK